ncbi:hypothetical protein C8T65DRAFT_701484 [Cerioporus squamosus]|nr:hypothetical protein C8T65DRAFT_701484 [Cerioporus squamosus]
MPTTRIYARWTSQMSLSLPKHPLPIPAHAYDAPIPLQACPRRGERVRIMALSPMAYRTMYAPIGTNKYDVYDPYVEGIVEGVVMASPSVVAFAVKNIRREAGVKWVVVSAPFVQETMVPPPEEDCPLEWLRSCLSSGTKEVELQEDAVVVDELGDDPSPPVTLQYPDPRVQRRDRMLMDRCGSWRPTSPKPAEPEHM